MDYSFTKTFSESQRAKIGSWVQGKLIEIIGECDEVFLEYVMVMVANGKTMGQIRGELVAFIGEESSTDFSLRLLHIIYLSNGIINNSNI